VRRRGRDAGGLGMGDLGPARMGFEPGDVDPGRAPRRRRSGRVPRGLRRRGSPCPSGELDRLSRRHAFARRGGDARRAAARHGEHRGCPVPVRRARLKIPYLQAEIHLFANTVTYRRVASCKQEDWNCWRSWSPPPPPPDSWPSPDTTANSPSWSTPGWSSTCQPTTETSPAHGAGHLPARWTPAVLPADASSAELQATSRMKDRWTSTTSKPSDSYSPTAASFSPSV